MAHLWRSKIAIMKHYFDYLPARLIEGKRWYIEFYQSDPFTGKRTRHREYNYLNRIKNLADRRAKAQAYIIELNSNLIPYGYPYVDNKHLPRNITLENAVKKAVDIKSQSGRSKTGVTYSSIANCFMDYVNDRKMGDRECREFGYREAIDFMDFVQHSKKLKERTYNNYRLFLTAMWNELIERGYVVENPWSKVKKKKVTEKTRRMLSDHEAKAILNHASQHNKELCLSILLLHYCFIRPGEQRMMKIQHFDLVNGIVNIPGDVSKNKKNDIVTIPSSVIKALDDVWPHKKTANNYLLGNGTKMISANALNNQHKTIINVLLSKNIIADITGISIYSWKDTGAMSLIKANINIYEIMRQMRHSDLNTTQKYLKSLSTINKEIRDLINPLLPTS